MSGVPRIAKTKVARGSISWGQVIGYTSGGMMALSSNCGASPGPLLNHFLAVIDSDFPSSNSVSITIAVFGIEAFVWIRVQNPGFRGAACGGLMAAANGEQGFRRMPDGTRRRSVHITTLLSLCLCVYQTGRCVEEGCF